MTAERRKRLALLAGAGVALLAYVFILRRRGGATSAAQNFDNLPASEGTDAGAVSGSGAAVTELAGQLADFVKVTEERQRQLEEQDLAFQRGIDDLVSDLDRTLSALDSGGGGWFTPQVIDNGTSTIVIGPDGQVTVVPKNGGLTTQGPAGQTPAGPNAKLSNALLWGGAVYGPGTGDQFVAEQLRPKGVNPAAWARKHPKAARDLGLSYFKAPAKPKKTTSAPKKKTKLTPRSLSFTPSGRSYVTGAPGSPTIGGGTVGGYNPPVTRLGGGSGTSSKKPLLLPEE